jgi:hypothetical protein
VIGKHSVKKSDRSPRLPHAGSFGVGNHLANCASCTIEIAEMAAPLPRLVCVHWVQP